MIRRKETWPELLDSYLRENNKKEYKYGTHDCVTFSAGVIETMTDINVLEDLEYNDVKSVMTILKEGGGLFAMTDKQLIARGLKQGKIGFAKRGDVVGFMTEKHGETVGICVGSKIVSPGENELVYLPMTEAVMIWEIK